MAKNKKAAKKPVKAAKDESLKGKGKGKVADPDIATVPEELLSDKGKKKAKKAKAAATEARGSDEVTTTSWSSTLAAGPGFSLVDLDPRSTPGFEGDKAAGEVALEGIEAELAELQERLYAESREGGERSLLLIIQGMDTSGKGGVMRYVVGAFDPQGVALTAFKAPTKEEREHPFLWRITNALPKAGEIGVFDRSQYEDVLIVRVKELVPRAQWARRYAQINAWEKKVASSGTTIVKVMLHISSDEQKARLTERLERPDKHWKYNPGDLDERARWADYMEAYQVAIEKCSTDVAPWHVVPADRKWYARMAVANLVLEHLRAMDPQWPVADFDVEAEKTRLAAMP